MQFRVVVVAVAADIVFILFHRGIHCECVLRHLTRNVGLARNKTNNKSKDTSSSMHFIQSVALSSDLFGF